MARTLHPLIALPMLISNSLALTTDEVFMAGRRKFDNGEIFDFRKKYGIAIKPEDYSVDKKGVL